MDAWDARGQRKHQAEAIAPLVLSTGVVGLQVAPFAVVLRKVLEAIRHTTVFVPVNLLLFLGLRIMSLEPCGGGKPAGRTFAEALKAKYVDDAEEETHMVRGGKKVEMVGMAKAQVCPVEKQPVAAGLPSVCATMDPNTT